MTYNKNVKKTTTAASKAKVEDVKSEEVAEVEVTIGEKEDLLIETSPVKSVPAPAPAPQKRKVDKSDSVAVRSVVNNELIYTSRRTHMTVEWASYGEIQYIEVDELMTMKSQQPRFLTQPWLIIEDEDVVEFLGLKSTYDKLIPIEDIESFILNASPEELEEKLMKAPNGMKVLVSDKARELIASDSLYDVRLIRVLNKVLNIDLTMIQ